MGEVGKEIRRLRAARGWGQTKLAAAADMAVSGVSQIENGHRNPNSATLIKLARALEVEVSDLFPKAQSSLPLEQPPLSRPAVREWLRANGHLTPDEFRDYALSLDLDVDEAGRPRGLERAIEELRSTRDQLIENLKRPATRNALFPKRTGLPTKEERIREALRPAKEAWDLEWEIRHNYLARQVELISYGRRILEGPDYESRLNEMLEEAYATASAA